MDGGGRGRGRAKSNLHPSSPTPNSLHFLNVDRLLGAIKIKDGGHNFRYENTEHSLAKITPALQARKRMAFLQTLKILWVAIDCNFL